MYLGSFIKKSREKHGLTQRQAAECLQVTPQYLSNIEMGKCSMAPDKVLRFSKIVGVPIDKFIKEAVKDYKESFILKMEG